MPSDVRHVDQFIYIDYDMNKDKYFDSMLDIRLLDLQCKHIMGIYPHNEDIYEAAEKAFSALHMRNRIVWGSHRNGTVETETAIIQKMAADEFDRPVRIIIDKYNRWWADNTHTVMSWVLRKGEDCVLREIPFYVVDLRKNKPKIISVNNSVHDSVKDIRMAIGCALRIKDLIEVGYRPFESNWFIGDLMDDIGLCEYNYE